MPSEFPRRARLALILLSVPALLISIPSAHAEETSATDSHATKQPHAVTAEPVVLRFSFQATPWRDVINWLAEETQSALYFGDLPPGSFTYTDPDPFTPEQAIDRINLFLLPQGYTLVRSGTLISVISLGDPRSMQQLSSMAPLVNSDELATLNDHDVVKCVFRLGELKAEDAVDELSALSLMTTPVTFTKTNQLMITDTAGKLKNVKAILDAFEPQMMNNGTVVKSFALQYADAEDVLVVARPHLGLATGEMIGIDVSLSADVEGKHIFVTGVEDKVKLIEGLVTAIDRPETDLTTNDQQPELRSHAIRGGNTEVVYNVLQTLLAGKSIRLSMDEEAQTVVALATPEIQNEIAETINQLQAADAEFAVMPLKWADPYFVISLLDEMLDLSPEFDEDGIEIPSDKAKVDADPANLRLFVRGKKHQIEEIKKIIEGLDVATNAEIGGNLRMLPIKGSQAAKLLETAATFWREPNAIILYPDFDDVADDQSERVVSEPKDATDLSSHDLSIRNRYGTSSMTLTAAKSIGPAADGGKWLTTNHQSSAPPIRCQLTGRGLLAQSEDLSALDHFEQHLRAVAGPLDSIPSKPIVFYLRYTKADDAIRMLAELLDGGVSAEDAVSGSLVNGFASSASSMYLGSIVTSNDGTTTMMADTMTVVADPRLNRLIAQGTTEDIDRIETYLRVIDKDRSITEILTHGASRMIELKFTRASEVAAAIREAFPNRVTAAPSSATASSGGKDGENDDKDQRALVDSKSDQERNSDKKASSKSAAAAPKRDLEPKMTVTVHEPSNSLIVTAPEQLFDEVYQLAMAIDQRSEQSIEVIAPVNAAAVNSMLRQVLLGESPTGRSFSNRSSSSQGSNSERSVPSMPEGSRGKLDR